MQHEWEKIVQYVDNRNSPTKIGWLVLLMISKGLLMESLLPPLTELISVRIWSAFLSLQSSHIFASTTDERGCNWTKCFPGLSSEILRTHRNPGTCKSIFRSITVSTLSWVDDMFWSPLNGSSSDWRLLITVLVAGNLSGIRSEWSRYEMVAVVDFPADCVWTRTRSPVMFFRENATLSSSYKCSAGRWRNVRLLTRSYAVRLFAIPESTLRRLVSASLAFAARESSIVFTASSIVSYRQK